MSLTPNTNKASTFLELENWLNDRRVSEVNAWCPT